MSFFTRKKLIIGACIIASIFFLYTAIGFMGVPWYVKRYLNNFAVNELQRQLTIENFYFNPYTLVTEINNTTLNEKNGKPIASLGKLFINVDLNELFNKAINVSALHLEDPRLDLVIDSKGRLNLDELISDLPAQNVRTDENPFFNFVFETIHINRGEVHVTDRSREEAITSTMRDINLQISGISTIEKEEGQYRVNLNLDRKTEMKLQGKLSLIPLTSDGHFRISNISVGNISRWLVDSLPVHQMTGNVNVNGNYTLDTDSEGKPVIAVSDGRGTIRELSASDRHSNMMILIKELSFSDFNYESTGQLTSVPEVTLSNLSLNNGEKQQVISLGNLSLDDFEFSGTEGNIALSGADIEQLTLYPRDHISPFLSLETLNLRSVSYSASEKLLDIGSVIMDTSQLLFETDADGRYILPSVPERVEVENENTGNVETEKNEAPGLQIKLDEMNLNGSRIAYLDSGSATGEREVINLKTAMFLEIDFNLSQQKTEIQELNLAEAQISMIRNQEGTVDLVNLIMPVASDSDPAEQNDSHDFMLNTLKLEGFNLLLEDNTRDLALQHRLHDLELSASNINTNGESRTDMSLYTGVNEVGFLSLEGWFEPGSRVFELQMALDDINLAAFDAYLRPATRLAIKSGSMSMVGRMRHSHESGFSIDNAEAGFADITINHAGTEQMLFTVNTVDTTGINLAMQPLDISVSEIKLSGPYANVHIDEQQNLNLLEAFHATGNGGVQGEGEDVTEQSAMKLAVERIDVVQGRMDFTDLSLTPRFSTYIHELTGTVSGLNSEPERYTLMELEGRVDEYGSTKITGELQPFEYRKQSDINLQFRNIDTNSLSPYAAKFAGRRIKSGSLSLNLNYRINNSKLQGNNAIVLKSLVLGEKVESPDAMDLPLDMAIALLQDENGKIDIDLPISGDLSNPQFEIEAVVQKAMGNLIGGIVSAPFKFIGSLFGISGEELREISFEPGSAAITPPEAEQIVILTKALIERPALKLTITGAYDPDLDMTALARQSLVSTINKKAGKDMTPLNYSSSELQVILDDLASEWMDISVLTAMKERFDSEQEDPEDIESATKDFYEAVFDMLVSQINIDKTVLESLARERIQSIIAAIRENEAGVTDRLSAEKEVKITESDNKLVNVTLEAGTIK